MAERHRAAKVARAPRLERPTPSSARNIAAILTLGDRSYFQFRGSPFGVPPLPWREGERLLGIIVNAQDAADRLRLGVLTGEGLEDARRAYFAAIEGLPAALWRNCEPASKVLRFLRRIGLARNPFTRATERELLGLADFFLERRTTSRVQYPDATPGRRAPEIS